MPAVSILAGSGRSQPLLEENGAVVSGDWKGSADSNRGCPAAHGRDAPGLPFHVSGAGENATVTVQILWQRSSKICRNAKSWRWPFRSKKRTATFMATSWTD